jgi:hypothetical protein
MNYVDLKEVADEFEKLQPSSPAWYQAVDIIIRILLDEELKRKLDIEVEYERQHQ